jgi:hypothetical protein
MAISLSTGGVPAWKVALIPVLSLVLFKVTRPSPSPDPTGDVVVAVDGAAPAADRAQPNRTLPLPELTLSDALSCDPFRSLSIPTRPAEAPLQPPADDMPEPPPAASPPVNRLAERAATLKQLKVSAIFPSAKGGAALVDSKLVRAGDVIAPGVRVVEVRRSDILVRVEDGETAPSTESSTR